MTFVDSFRTARSSCSERVCNRVHVRVGKLFHILPKFADHVVVPPAVVDEIEVGRAAGVPLPDLADLGWVIVQRPVSVAAVPLLTNLEPGEAEVLMLTIEQKQVVALLDDALARRIADTLDLPFTGTLGLLNNSEQFRAAVRADHTEGTQRAQVLHRIF
jgi:predicted nucleic acid-binding protein